MSFIIGNNYFQLLSLKSLTHFSFFVLINFLCWTNLRFTERLKRIYRMSCVLLIQFSLIVNILHYSGQLSKLRNQHWCITKLNFRLHLNFTSFYTNFLFLFQDPIQNTTLYFIIMFLCLYGLWQFLSFSLIYDLDTFEEYFSGIFQNVAWKETSISCLAQ